MPAKKQVTKEMLIDCAFEIVREYGIEALNMRSLAKACNCSTQPIYLSFNGAEDLKSAVTDRICKEFDSYIECEIKEGKFPEYKAVGMGYIRFAKEEKELFKCLLMRDRSKENDWEKHSFDKSTYMIMKSYGLYRDDATKLHAEMWIFVHGFATMLATGYQDWDFETISEMLSDVYKGLMNNLKGD